MAEEIPKEVNCPVCGKAAEAGAIYADDRSDLRWLPGEPSWRKNFAVAMAGGERVGVFPSWAGTHACGIFCRSCNRIIIDVVEKANYYPDVHG